MVPSSSAQREPSMEEILASIRRIIEDNDAGRKQPTDGDPGEAESDERNVIEVDAFRSELRGSHDESGEQATGRIIGSGPDVSSVANDPVARDDSGQDSTMRPAPVMDAARDRSPSLDRSAAEERIRLAIENARIRSAEMERSLDVEKPAEVARVDAPEVPAEAAPEPVEAAKAPVEPARQPEPESSLQDIESDLDEAFASLPTVIDTPEADRGPYKPAFLSEQAERKIAASFGELSEAFAARSQKTFDEMAEQMLQPMLRDWLDNNLPVLVERLVREEIERVARGSQ